MYIIQKRFTIAPVHVVRMVFVFFAASLKYFKLASGTVPGFGPPMTRMSRSVGAVE